MTIKAFAVDPQASQATVHIRNGEAFETVVFRTKSAADKKIMQLLRDGYRFDPSHEFDACDVEPTAPTAPSAPTAPAALRPLHARAAVRLEAGLPVDIGKLAAAEREALIDARHRLGLALESNPLGVPEAGDESIADWAA